MKQKKHMSGSLPVTACMDIVFHASTTLLTGIYYRGARPGETDQNAMKIPGFHPEPLLKEKEDGIYLAVKFDSKLTESHTAPVNTERLGMTIVSEAIFEQSDGTPYLIYYDYFSRHRGGASPVPDPFEQLKNGKGQYKIW